jgi:hypothetical protein
LNLLLFYDKNIILVETDMTRSLTTELARQKGYKYLMVFHTGSSLTESWEVLKKVGYRCNSAIKDLEVLNVA